MIQTDPKLGDKCKIFEESKKSRKKQKADKIARARGLTNEDYNHIVDQMEEVTNATCKRIDERNTDLVGGITNLL